MKLVSSLLRVDQSPDAFLLALNEKQHYGSCQWLTGDHLFEEWVDNPVYWEDVDPLQKIPEDQPPKILWLNGRPGTGKSVASGHVIRYLEACNLDCSFYFFRHSDKAYSTVSGLLRSLAFQMAESSFEVRRAIVSVIEDDVRINHDDHHMLWNKLFVDRIFKIESTRPQFWVIDAVDECSSKAMPALVSMLSNLGCKNAVRVFMTSRPGGQLERLLTQERTEFLEMNTGQAGSLRDIELFLRARCPQVGDAESYHSLVADILSKSNGIFLWASLTMARLEDIYSVEDMQDILRQIPSEMDGFYSRIVASIAASPSSELAKCILKWMICSPKPLTTGELAEAVKLDIGRTLTASPSQLETITGHLAFVDNQSRIHIAHQTISAFLTRQRDDFWIDRPGAHSRLAEICLVILSGKEFTPPPPRTRRDTATKGGQSALSEYASANFTYHLMHCSSFVDAPLILLNKFLRLNVLTWIERIARTGDLSVLRQAPKRLKAYLGRRTKYQPPLSVEIQTVAAWVTDLYHIVAAFSSCLVASPSSIHFLIPHFCPPNSIIHQVFSKSTKRLRITGPFESDWNDRLTCYLFSEEASSVACCERAMAVGLAKGDIKIYNSGGSSLFDSIGTLNHGKRVRNLAFNQSSSLLASCSARKLMLWDIHRSSGLSFPCLWSQEVDFTASDMIFSSDGNSITLANSQYSAIVTFRVTDGLRGKPVLLHAPSDSDSSDESDEKVANWTPSERVRLDSSHRLAALAYRNASVALWDLDAVDKIGYFEKEGFENVYASPQTLDMIFNPVSELELFAVTYKDGDLVTCNPWTLEQTGKYHLQVSLVVLAATSDGRILAGGAEDGAIYLFLFETLQLLHHIERPDEQLRIYNITFSADNLRFFDIRGQCCNVWEPFVLVPRDGSDDNSSEPQSEEVIAQEPATSRAHVFQWGEAITTIEQTADGSFLFVGRQDGTIDICELSTGATIDKLRLHDGFTEIRFLDWNDEKRLLLSVDTTGRCIITHISFSGKDSKPQECALMDHRECGSVRQALICPDGTSFLICTDSGVKLMGVNGDLMGEEATIPKGCWMSHPSNPLLLILAQAEHVHIFYWASLKKFSVTEGITLSAPEDFLWAGNDSWICRQGSSYLVRGFNRSRGRVGDFVALEASKVTPGIKKAPLQTHNVRSLDVQTILGVLRSSLYFMDMTGWVCSVSLKNLNGATYYTRHFFIPLTWHTGGDIVLRIISKNAVAFARGEQLIVFHGFLEFEEKVALEGENALALRPAV
jgi:WD40 repeat protein